MDSPEKGALKKITQMPWGIRVIFPLYGRLRGGRRPAPGGRYLKFMWTVWASATPPEPWQTRQLSVVLNLSVVALALADRAP